jgi:hypothetical protein
MDTILITFLNNLPAILTALAGVIVAWRNLSNKIQDVQDTADRRNAVSAGKLNDLAAVTNTVHTLVNSNMGTEKKIAMIALKRVAELTGHPDDKAAAEEAEKSYNAHIGMQADADNKRT